MNKKGYTLIELLAVLSVMAIILLIAIPSITKQLSDIEENKYAQFKQNLYLAAESYINAFPSSFTMLKMDGGKACIDVTSLIEDGWIKSSFNNPKTNKAVSLNSSVKVTNISGEYKYTYFPNQKCS